MSYPAVLAELQRQFLLLKNVWPTTNDYASQQLSAIQNAIYAYNDSKIVPVRWEPYKRALDYIHNTHQVPVPVELIPFNFQLQTPPAETRVERITGIIRRLLPRNCPSGLVYSAEELLNRIFEVVTPDGRPIRWYLRPRARIDGTLFPNPPELDSVVRYINDDTQLRYPQATLEIRETDYIPYE